MAKFHKNEKQMFFKKEKKRKKERKKKQNIHESENLWFYINCAMRSTQHASRAATMWTSASEFTQQFSNNWLNDKHSQGDASDMASFKIHCESRPDQMSTNRNLL